MSPGEVYSLARTVNTSDADRTADAVFMKVKTLATDTFSQSETNFSILEAFSKLDFSSSLERRTQVAVRIYCTDDRTAGFRVLAFSLNKDHRFGSKVGYRQVPREEFPLRNNPITENFINLATELVLDVQFYMGKEGSMIRATGQADGSYSCQTLIEFCQATDRKALFRSTQRQ